MPLGEYRGIAVTKQLRNYETDLENRLRQLQDSIPPWKQWKGTVENGDIVVMDFTGYLDGEPFEGGAAEGYSLEIGSGQLIPGFEEQMIKDEAGRKKSWRLLSPMITIRALAGKPALFLK